MNPSLHLAWQVAAFTLTRAIINTAFRMMYPFRTVIARSLGVPVEAITLALTLRASTGFLGPVLGSVADSQGRRRAILLGAGLFVAAMLLVSVLPLYPALFISIVLVGALKIIFDPAVYAYLGDHVPYHRRGLVIGLTELGWSGAFFLGVPLVGWLIERGGWSAPFPWLALAGLLMFAVLWRIVPPDQQGGLSRPSLRQGIGIVLRHPPALAGLAINLLICASNESINIIYGQWMEESFGLQVVALGLASGVIGVAELAGEGAVAGVVDRVGKRRAVAFGLAAYALTCLLLPLANSLNSALVSLFLFYLAFEFTLVSLIPLMTELLPEARATLLSGNVAAASLGRVVGSLLGPALFTFGLPANAAAGFLMNLLGLAALLLVMRRAAFTVL